jgi:hypothetical protein
MVIAFQAINNGYEIKAKVNGNLKRLTFNGELELMKRTQP